MSGVTINTSGGPKGGGGVEMLYRGHQPKDTSGQWTTPNPKKNRANYKGMGSETERQTLIQSSFWLREGLFVVRASRFRVHRVWWLPERQPAVALLSTFVPRICNWNRGVRKNCYMSRPLILTYFLYYCLPWNLDDTELAICWFGYSDAHIVNQLIGVDHDRFSIRVHTQAKLLVSWIRIHWKFVNSIFLNCRKIPEHPIESHFHLHYIARVVDNLCRTHSCCLLLLLLTSW